MTADQHPSYDDLALMTEASQLFSLTDLNTLLKQAVALSVRAVDAQAATLALLPAYGGSSAILSANGKTDAPVQLTTTDLSGGLMTHLTETGEGVLIADISHDSRWSHPPDGKTAQGAALGLPLRSQDVIIGTLTLLHTQTDYFTDHHLKLMELIAVQMAGAVTNLRTIKQMLAQRQQLEAVLQAIPDVLLVIDDSGHVLRVSDAIIELLGGVRPQDVIGQTIDQLAQQDTLFIPVRRFVSSPPSGYGEWSVEVRSEPRDRDYLINITVWEDYVNESAGYVVLLKDITVLRNLNRFKDEMVRLVSHDLRTPLVLIVGYADLMQSDTQMGAGTENVTEYTNGILRAASRMDEMLERMLHVERIRSTPLELHEEVHLDEVAEKTTRSAGPLAQRKGLTFENELRVVEDENTRPAILFGDRMLVQQAMENLVSNAVKYTETGWIRIASSSENGRYHFSVTDTGVGIAADELPHVFESFFRADQGSNKPLQSGVGLGLSLVKNVVKKHGGDVWVESEKDQGSTFGFWLPLADLP